MKKYIFLLSLLIAVVLSMNAHAGPTYRFDFNAKSGNESTNGAIGHVQFFMDVELLIDNTVLFKFLNDGPLDSTITSISFEDTNDVLGRFDTFSDIIEVGSHKHDGVKFEKDSSPHNFVSGGPFKLNATSRFSAKSPSAFKGIDPGESLGINFAVNTNEIIENLNSGNLKIGLHVQSFSNNKSEKFINNKPDNPVPEPATLLLLGFGLLGLAGIGRKKGH